MAAYRALQLLTPFLHLCLSPQWHFQEHWYVSGVLYKNKVLRNHLIDAYGLERFHHALTSLHKTGRGGQGTTGFPRTGSSICKLRELLDTKFHVLIAPNIF